MASIRLCLGAICVLVRRHVVPKPSYKMGGLHVPFFRHPHHETPQGGRGMGHCLCSEEPLPQEFHITPSGSFGSRTAIGQVRKLGTEVAPP